MPPPQGGVWEKIPEWRELETGRAKWSKLSSARERQGQVGNEGARPLSLKKRTEGREAWTTRQRPGGRGLDTGAASAFLNETSPLGSPRGREGGTGLQTGSPASERSKVSISLRRSGGTVERGPCLARSCCRPTPTHQHGPSLHPDEGGATGLGPRPLSTGVAGPPLRDALTLGPLPCPHSRGSRDPVSLWSQRSSLLRARSSLNRLSAKPLQLKFLPRPERCPGAKLSFTTLLTFPLGKPLWSGPNTQHL